MRNGLLKISSPKRKVIWAKSLTLSRRSDGPRMGFRTENLIDFTKKIAFQQKICQILEIFSGLYKTDQKTIRNLTFSLQKAAFPKIPAGILTYFMKKGRVLAKTMPTFGNFSERQKSIWNFFQNLTFFSLKRDLFHEIDDIFDQKYISQPQLKLFCTVRSALNRGYFVQPRLSLFRPIFW